MVFLSILVLDGPDIIKFIAPQSFIDAYLEKQLYNEDPTLILPQETLGFYNWERFAMGTEVLSLIKASIKDNTEEITHVESMVLTPGNKRLVLTVGSTKELSLSQWFFEEKPNFDHLLG